MKTAIYDGLYCGVFVADGLTRVTCFMWKFLKLIIESSNAHVLDCYPSSYLISKLIVAALTSRPAVM